MKPFLSSATWYKQELNSHSTSLMLEHDSKQNIIWGPAVFFNLNSDSTGVFTLWKLIGLYIYDCALIYLSYIKIEKISCVWKGEDMRKTFLQLKSAFAQHVISNLISMIKTEVEVLKK